jgi:hypothetical protein
MLRGPHEALLSSCGSVLYESTASCEVTMSCPLRVYAVGHMWLFSRNSDRVCHVCDLNIMIHSLRFMEYLLSISFHDDVKHVRIVCHRLRLLMCRNIYYRHDYIALTHNLRLRRQQHLFTHNLALYVLTSRLCSQLDLNCMVSRHHGHHSWSRNKYVYDVQMSRYHASWYAGGGSHSVFSGDDIKPYVIGTADPSMSNRRYVFGAQVTSPYEYKDSFFYSGSIGADSVCYFFIEYRGNNIGSLL